MKSYKLLELSEKNIKFTNVVNQGIEFNNGKNFRGARLILLQGFLDNTQVCGIVIESQAPGKHSSNSYSVVSARNENDFEKIIKKYITVTNKDLLYGTDENIDCILNTDDDTVLLTNPNETIYFFDNHEFINVFPKIPKTIFDSEFSERDSIEFMDYIESLVKTPVMEVKLDVPQIPTFIQDITKNYYVGRNIIEVEKGSRLKEMVNRSFNDEFVVAKFINQMNENKETYLFINTMGGYTGIYMVDGWINDNENQEYVDIKSVTEVDFAKYIMSHPYQKDVEYFKIIETVGDIQHLMRAKVAQDVILYEYNSATFELMFEVNPHALKSDLIVVEWLEMMFNRSSLINNEESSEEDIELYIMNVINLLKSKLIQQIKNNFEISDMITSDLLFQDGYIMKHLELLPNSIIRELKNVNLKNMMSNGLLPYVVYISETISHESKAFEIVDPNTYHVFTEKLINLINE